MPGPVACGDDATAEHPSRSREVTRVNRALSRIAPTRLRRSAAAARGARSSPQAVLSRANHVRIKQSYC